MKRKIKKIVTVATKRFFQVLLINILLSAFITMLNMLKIIKTQELIFVSTCAGVLLSMLINMSFMRKYYYDLANKFMYYISNYIAYVLFFVVNLGVGAIFNNEVYAWLFSIAKFARFSHYGWSSLISAIIFNILMIASIHLAPIGMGWLVTDEDYDIDD